MKSVPAPVPAGFKHCFKCGEDKPLTSFYLSSRKDRPMQERGSWCSACRRAYYATPEWKQWFVEYQRGKRAEKRAYFCAQKVAAGCADCGERHPACLEFHHTDPSEKSTEVVRLIDSNASVARIQAEADKCTVLCSNCHRKRHYIDREAQKVLRLA